MITEIFYEVDNFIQYFKNSWEQFLLTDETKKVQGSRMIMSEIMTICIFFHVSNHKNFKSFYLEKISVDYASYFPNLVSYNRFVELMPRILVPLSVFLKSFRMSKATGISFIDSTKISVCKNKRIPVNKVFEGIAKRGKTSIDWFYGFKVHLIVSDKGDLVSVSISKGNKSDRDKILMKKITQKIFGKLFGDKGYISKHVTDELRDRGIELITNVHKKMKPKVIPIIDKILLRKRCIIETINDQIKNICQIEHSRHRNPENFFINLLSGLIAYTFLPNKPSIRLNKKDYEILKLSYPIAI